MLKEYHYDHLVRWPRGERAAVFLTFDFQGGEDVKPDKNTGIAELPELEPGRIRSAPRDLPAAADPEGRGHQGRRS